VTRLHGGKGSLNKQFISSKKTSQLLDDNDDALNNDSDDIDDMDMMDSAEEDTYQSSGSDVSSKKRAAKKRLASKHVIPNVAIRVAKVAYYNSKGTINSQNPFKSTIFSHGGIRGNFFSQERLPLRSCKIKMKITTALRNEKKSEENAENSGDLK
jgi:hypothetical protein